MKQQRCGYVAIVGRPNVGKSTLLNQLLGTKLCITSRKPQTTRHTILGIKTEAETQCLFVDTPGLHNNQQNTMNKLMNRSVNTVVQDVDVVMFVVDALVWNEADQQVLNLLKTVDVPVILVLNKIDKLKDKQQLLPHLQKLSGFYDFAEMIPLSAFVQKDMATLFELVVKYLPQAEHLYEDEQLSDRSLRFFMSEIVREKITRQLGDEIPYNVAVEIEQFEEKPNSTHIVALILVEREGQKRMIVGQQGARIKQIGEQARKDMEAMLGCKVMLKLWVKVKRGWADDMRALQSLGIE